LTDDVVRLGLIGNGIGRSSAPRLHELAGGLSGIRVEYPLIDLDGRPFEAFDGVLAETAASGRRAVNVTHPYKERAAALVPIPDPRVVRIGASNTVLFEGGVPVAAHNTDYTGFVAAYRRAMAKAAPGDAAPGVVAIAGAGGVGRPIAAGLQELGAREIRVFDPDAARAGRLVAALTEEASPVVAVPSIEAATDGADGIVNASPIGMYRYPGNPVPTHALGRPRWVFDAVYTPVETEFVLAARVAGAAVISGYELFIHQGIHAFRHFTGLDVDETALRAALKAEGR
jgi:shikimate dehydrogenase